MTDHTWVRSAVIPAALLTMLLGGCGRGESLHGQISQLTPSVCVAAERATGECFQEGNGTELFRDYQVGDCVYLTYHEEQEGRPTEQGPELVATEVRPAACKEGWHPPVVTSPSAGLTSPTP